MAPKKEQQYSKTGRKLSMKASAIQSREKRAREKNEAANGDGDGDGENGTPSTGSIGVQTPAKLATQAYHCSNCDEDVTLGTKNCPMCGISLNWPE